MSGLQRTSCSGILDNVLNANFGEFIFYEPR
jgi:hypothetical protein